MTSAQESASSEGLLLPVQARRRLGISHRTFQRWVASGRIVPTLRLPNGHARYSPEYIESLVTRPAAAEGAGVPA